MRMLAVFTKGERLRHIGHLDLMRAMQRALRRSELPVSYSKGFNPHILVTFASALSTGAWSKREIMDVTLDTEVTPESFAAAMNRALPVDLRVLSARPIDDRHPALMAMVAAAEYAITVMDADTAAKLAACREAFLAQAEIITPRKTKSGVKDCDIKPLMYGLSMKGDVIHACLCLTESSSCKPDMLLTAWCGFAGCEAPRHLICREQLFGRDAAGELAPLETL